jgi:hypothetical protein
VVLNVTYGPTSRNEKPLSRLLASHQGSLPGGKVVPADEQPIRAANVLPSRSRKESPQTFLGRKVRYTCLLTVTDNGGPDEVQQIMCTAPIAWSSILIVENIHSVEDLYERVNKHEEELMDMVARRQIDVLTTGNLSSTLK